jgi:filamentous hemagglutinin
MGHRCPYRLRSGWRQAGLRHPGWVDEVKQLMLAGRWDFAGQGATFVYWRQGQTVWVADGHHRANAALEIGRTTGDWSYLDRLLEFGRIEQGLPPPDNEGRFPTRGWWSRLLSFLGL